MPLEFSTVEIPYGQLDTHTDPTAMEPGTLTTAENVSSDVDGHYAKRFGYDAMPAVGSEDCVRLAKRGKELLLIDSFSDWKYITPTASWSGGLPVPHATPSQQYIAMEQSRDFKKCASATTLDVSLHAYIDSSTGNVEVRAFSEIDKSIVASYSDGLADYEIVHVRVVGDLLVVFYSSSAGQVIKYRTFDPTNLAFGTLTTIYSGVDVFAGTVAYPYAPFDVCAYDSSNVCFAWATDTPEIKVIRRNVVLHTNSTSAVTLAAEEPDGGFGICMASSTYGAVLFHSATSTALRVRGFNPTTSAAVFATATVEGTSGATGVNFNAGMCAVSSTSILAVWDRRGPSPNKGNTRYATISLTGTVGSITIVPNIFMHTKPWTYSSRQYVAVLAPYDTQETYFTLEINIGVGNGAIPIAMHAYRTAFAEGQAMACLSDIDNPEPGIYKFDAPIGYKFLSNTSLKAAVANFKLDYTDPLRFMNIELGDSTFFTGGITFRYDGLHMLENNFLLYPEILTATPGAVGGSGMDNGLYSYIVVYESSDQNGNVDRSTTSLPMAATTTAGAGLGKVDLRIDHLTVTGHIFSTQKIVASIFRTEAGGETYYFIGSQTVDTTAHNFTYTDSAHDSTIISNRIIYSQGGILDREPLPPCTQIVVHNNRIWGFSGKTVYYSGEYVPGESPWFSSLQQFRIEQGADITALASLDEKLIIFKRDRVFKVTGRGANATGSGSDLTPPDVITSDCGCIEPRSVIVIPQGVIFQSDKGIYMLSRGEELTYIGMPVSRYVDDFPTITAATMMPSIREVRFQATDSEGDGVVLVYNYRDNRWTTHTNYDYGDGSARIDALVVDNVYTTADHVPNVSQETTGYRDPENTYIVSEIETGWIKPAGKQGLVRVQRVLFLNEFVEEHDMEFEMDKDYVDTAVQSAQYAAADIASLPQEQVSLHVQNQQGEAWRFRMRDAESSDSESQGYKARGVTLTVGLKRGTFEKVMQAGAKA